MKTLIGLGTALTIATAPMALSAETRFDIRGGGAVVQMLNGAINGNAKQIRKAEKKLRKAARKAGVPVSLSTVTAAATGRAANSGTTRSTTAQPAPAPVLAPTRVSQRPQLRPAVTGPAEFETAAATPPVTTVRDGARIEASTVSTTAAPSARASSTETVEASTGPKVVQVENTGTAPQPLDASQADDTALAPQQASVEADASPFGGSTGY